MPPSALPNVMLFSFGRWLLMMLLLLFKKVWSWRAYRCFEKSCRLPRYLCAWFGGLAGLFCYRARVWQLTVLQCVDMQLVWLSRASQTFACTDNI
jgi:hypothetical protein